MKFLAWWLRHVAGDALARDILGDVAESGGGSARLAAIAMGVTLRRAREAFASIVPGRAVGADLRYAVRSLMRAKWYAATTIGVIALGMALATTVFAVVDGVLFKKLPYPDARHLYLVTGEWTSRPEAIVPPSWSDLAAWRAAIPEARFTIAVGGGRVSIDGGEPLRSVFVTSNFFDVIGQRPLLGGLGPDDFRAYAATEARPLVISYAAWQSRLGGDPAVIGRVVQGDNGQRSRIAGVLAPDFVFPIADGRFVPDAIGPEIEPANQVRNRDRAGSVFARTPATLSNDVFSARLQAATSALKQEFPKQPAERGLGPIDAATAKRIDIALGSSTRRMFLVAFGGAVVLVILACLNVAGLSATRIHDRRHELWLRRALGGGRGDVVRVLACEAAVVAGIGGALGLGGAAWLVRLAGAVLPANIVLFKTLSIDARVSAFTLCAVVVTAGLTTLWPVREAGAENIRSRLAGAGAVRRSRSRARFAMVATQVALGLIMAVSGVLVTGSLVKVWRQSPGYDPENTVFLELRARTKTDVPLNQEILDAMRAIPGVAAAGGSNGWFMSRAFGGTSFDEPAGAGEVPGHGIDDAGVTPGFLQASGLPLLAGRWPTDDELLNAESVIVVSEITARAYWPGRSAIGQVLMRKGRPFTVVGISAAARQLSLDTEPDGIIYFPIGVSAYPSLQTVFVRFADGVRPDLARLLAAIETPRFSAYAVRRAMTVQGALGDSVRNRKFQALVFSGFGVAAVVIVGVGVLGLVAMITARRTREMGVRVALGANPSSIVGLVVRQELTAVLAGIGAGGVVSWWTVGFVEAYLFKTPAHDPLLWSAAAAALLAVGLVGAIVPALRASRVDPVMALRVE